MENKKRKVILLIRDGWGYGEEKENNAIFNTATPNTDFLMKNYPNTLVKTSGESVGLPAGYHGNAEDQTESFRTSHTINHVPFILISDELKNAKLKENKWLQDIAPTVLRLMGISKPFEMSGESLILG